MNKSSLLAEVEVKYKSLIAPSDRLKINSSKDVYDYLSNVWSDDIELFESVYVLLLNNANEVLGWRKISSGGSNSCFVDVKLVFHCALLHNCSNIIISHNHPSGSLKSSTADHVITEKIKAAGVIMDIPLLDHLIVTRFGYYSFLDEGLI